MSFMNDARKVRLGSRDYTVKPESASLHAHLHLYSMVGARCLGVLVTHGEFSMVCRRSFCEWSC